MRPGPVDTTHHAAILRNNQQFVHWLSPLNANDLADLLGQADYARQCLKGEAVLIAYNGNGPYRHKNVDWLSRRVGSYVYIDRIIIGAAAQGEGLGRLLYDDLIDFATQAGFSNIACEVNTNPDNPGSHAFHQKLGFQALEEETYGGVSLRYYRRKL